MGEDPDVHVNHFNMVAQANNQAADTDKLRVFSATLDGFASNWYAQFPTGHFATWDGLRTAFLTTFRPIGYSEPIREELDNVRLLPNETLQMYANKVKCLISKHTQPLDPQDQVGWFIKGLPSEVHFFVKI